MDLLLNDLSIHEQFHDLTDLQRAFAQLIEMRRVAWSFEREVRCTRLIYGRKPIPGVELLSAINRISNQNLKRAILSWLTRSGPFWEESQKHSGDDWLECEGELIVTDTGVGEAAFRMLNDEKCGLITIYPSDWTYNPLLVTWKRGIEATDTTVMSVNNWWAPRELENDLARMRSPIGSWQELAESSVSSFDGLTFFEESFDPLFKLPFSRSASNRIGQLLTTLSSLVRAYDADGNRTGEGHKIYSKFFTGERAWFSDSSDSEKRRFREELKFSDRTLQISGLSCTWHGKINYTTPIRMHFSWPIQAGKPLYIVYIGPKKTMR
ncbi:MAG: hypothetical protein OXD43_01735 [Bacteroidetes bacterium]|nr:hypothetical protein [Bacteroidota bacterium]